MSERGYMLRSKRDDWLTPPDVLDVVRKALGAIDLDPCGNAESVVGAERQYLLHRGEDGLALPWEGRFFVNPPFSTAARWLAKAHEEARLLRGADDPFEGIVLMPARVDTKAFHRHGVTADAICFWKGRITFVDPETGLPAKASAPFPVMFLYWGPFSYRFSSVFSKHGHVMKRSPLAPPAESYDDLT